MKKNKALPPAPLSVIMNKISSGSKKSSLDEKIIHEALANWPDTVDKITDKEMIGCCETLTGVECSFDRFIGIHFSKLAKVLKDIRRLKGISIEKAPNCMPLNYHHLNEAMKDIKNEELKIDDFELTDPFVISDVIIKDLVNTKIYLNLIK